MKYVVRTVRTEYVDYELEASSSEDAEERYLMEGDEVHSDSNGDEVLEVLPAAEYHEHT